VNDLLIFVIGAVAGVTTVVFGFGGGFVAVPVIIWADASLGGVAPTVAVATSSVVMVINAAVATAATPPAVLARLRRSAPLLALLAAGGAAGALLAHLAPAAVISWGFIVYLLATIADVLLRPGFIHPAKAPEETAGTHPIPTALGAPIGTIASFLGVGGSVMTVPMLRRAGFGMRTAASLANPLTLAISLPACLVFLLISHPAGTRGAALAGVVDLHAAAALLTGAIPVVIVLRRRPPRLPDRVHARGYVVLLVVVLAAMLVSMLVSRTG
jgi:uncharacterized protein